MTHREAVEAPHAEHYSQHVVAWGKTGGRFFSDVSQGLLAFIPNGLAELYDSTLKKTPLFGKFFSRTWVEQVFKLCLGITIGQGLAHDIGHYVFKPIGFILGALLGATVFSDPRFSPHYQGKFGHYLKKLSGQTVCGALLGVIIFYLGILTQPGMTVQEIPLKIFSLAALVGGAVGLVSKSMMMVAIHTVSAANAASSRLNANRANKLSQKLKSLVNEKAEQVIKHHASCVILKMNTPIPQEVLEEFLNASIEEIGLSTYQKLARHINYLADRAVHGDLSALKRLYKIHGRPKEEQAQLNEMLERIINQKEIDKIKDKADTLFDQWKYRAIRTP